MSQSVIQQVPLDYYQNGIKHNFLQKTWHTRKLESVISQINFYPKTILDVGCASGWFLYQLKKRYPKAKCFGVDIYKEGVMYGRKKYPKLTLKVADAHALPFKAGMFDLVVCTEVLEHVEKPSKVLLEMQRVLKKNGLGVIELDSGSILFSVVWFLWKKAHGKVWDHAHLHSFSVKKLDVLLKKTGFTIISKKRFNLGMAMVFFVRKKSAL